MGAAASAAYSEGIANAEIDKPYTYDDTSTQTTYTCTTGLQVIGGTVTSTSAPFDVDAWTATISENPAVVGYGSNGLTAMWELAADGSQRQADLKNGLAAYFSQPNPYTLAPLTLKVFQVNAAASNGPESVQGSVDAGYKILGVGASLYQGSPDNQFLTACFMLNDQPPRQWISSGKSVHNSTSANLASYAIAVYDPDNLLDVRVFASGASSCSGSPSVSQAVGDGYVMTGGGVSTAPDNAYGLMLIASYPSSNTTWYGYSAQHSDACTGTVTAYAIGIKWNDPTGKPVLATKIMSATSAPSGAPSATVGVDLNYTLVGGGAWVGGSNSYNIMLQDSYPSGSGPQARWNVQGHDAQTGASNPITAYTVGLQVQNSANSAMPFGPGCQSAT